MRLIYNERDDNYLYPAPKNQPQTPREAEFSFSLDESLNLLNDTWLPVPFSALIHHVHFLKALITG